METNQRQGTLNQKETVLYSFDKSAKEQVRISETIYLDRPFIDFRIFARRADGQYIPTQKGITISKDLAKYLKEAFNKIN
ncbi:MAG TPA: transcriptional coactivator p15/PC4 family protein [bacterium]|nr:transcriptional coactivator p15/PC4 family protein [bacterium]